MILRERFERSKFRALEVRLRVRAALPLLSKRGHRSKRHAWIRAGLGQEVANDSRCGGWEAHSRGASCSPPRLRSAHRSRRRTRTAPNPPASEERRERSSRVRSEWRARRDGGPLRVGALEGEHRMRGFRVGPRRRNLEKASSACEGSASNRDEEPEDPRRKASL